MAEGLELDLWGLFKPKPFYDSMIVFIVIGIICSISFSGWIASWCRAILDSETFTHVSAFSGCACVNKEKQLLGPFTYSQAYLLAYLQAPAVLFQKKYNLLWTFRLEHCLLNSENEFILNFVRKKMFNSRHTNHLYFFLVSERIKIIIYRKRKYSLLHYLKLRSDKSLRSFYKLLAKSKRQILRAKRC